MTRPESVAAKSLGEFLRSRRAALDPEQAGAVSWGRQRRVPGLRREEVAQLAGVSVAYYTRMEQGQARNASTEVLMALARALQLTRTETEHLLDLAQPSPLRPLPRTRPERPQPRALAMMEAIADQPAVLLGRRNDVLAWTRMGHALLAPHVLFDSVSDPATRPSIPRLLFLDPQVRVTFAEWEKEARTNVAYLRLVSGKYPDDTRLAELVGELCMKSPEFASMWASGRVGECTGGIKYFQHPLVGELSAEFQIWLKADSPDHRLEVYTPADRQSADALSLLGTVMQEVGSPPGSLGPEGAPAPGSRASEHRRRCSSVSPKFLGST